MTMEQVDRKKKKTEELSYDAMLLLSFGLMPTFVFPQTTEASDAPTAKSDDAKKSSPITLESFKLFVEAALIAIRDALAMASVGRESITVYSDTDEHANKPAPHTHVSDKEVKLEEPAAWKKAAPVTINTGLTQFKPHVDTSASAVQKLSQMTLQLALETALNTVFTKMSAILASFAQALKEHSAESEKRVQEYANVRYTYAPGVK